MQLFRELSIRQKLTGFFMALACITALTISVPMAIYDFKSFEQAMAQDLGTLGDALARNSTAALTFHDAAAARDVLQALRAEPSVTAACIYTLDGKPFARYVRDGRGPVFVPPPPETQTSRFEGDRLVQFRRILLADETVGTLYLESDLSRLYARMRRYQIVFMLTVAVTLVLALLAAARFQRPISQPLLDLVRTAKAVSGAGDYSIRAKLLNRDEFGVLVAEFNGMLEQIEKRDQELCLHREHLEEKVAARTAELRQTEEKYRGIFENAIVGIYQSRPDGRVISLNQAAASICGYDSPEQLLAEITDVARQLYVDPARREEMMRMLSREGVVRDFEYQIRRRDGKKAWLLQNVRAVKNTRGEIELLEGMLHDITERKQLEAQLRQAQKMEAVGRLAGRVAHDFNNALGVIIGYGELLKANFPAENPMHRHAEQIVKAGQRAASLTRQLLAFSRKQTIQPVVLDLNSVVADIDKMLRRLIGEDIDLTLVRESKLKCVMADRGQVEQILMNLAVNARDAMPRGGKLIIETANVELGESDVEQHSFLKAGRYVCLNVTDTGCGMHKDVQAHIFEPFFTTKESGKGTGLGLSTVYGIVKQSEGYILVDSEAGKGTSFRIYLPQVEAARQTSAAAGPPARTLPQGTETILLVEDEDSFRGLARGCLQSRGYTVLEARDGASALQVAKDYAGPIHLLITDVIMPGISGRDLAEQLRPSRPEMKLLYMSGYTHDLVSEHGILDSTTVLLEKPFSIEALLTKVRDVLDDKMARDAGAS